MLSTREISHALIDILHGELDWNELRIGELKESRGRTVAIRMEAARELEKRKHYGQIIKTELAARASRK